MRKVIVFILILICITSLYACNANDETNFTKMEDLESWISDEWPLITDFKVLYIKVDTLDEPQHSKSIVMIKASYKHNGEFVSKNFTFEITYDEFLILYDNNGFIVYNVEKEGGDIVTDINSNSLSVLKKAFKENWQTYSENSNDSIEDNEIVNIALEHCKTNYDFIDTTYDSVNDEWTVEFWETGAKLPAQRVFLDKNGNVINVWFAE